MTEVILGLIIFALIGFIGWREKHFSVERKDLIAGILSKDVHEFTIATTPIQKVKEAPKQPSELMEESALSDDEFYDAIVRSNN